MQYEWGKLLRQRRLVWIVTLVLLALYLVLAFGGFYHTFSGRSATYLWQDEAYRRWMMAQEAETVDEAWIENKRAEYAAFIDANRLTPEEMEAHIAEKQAEGFAIDCTAEEVLADPYNLDNAFLILPTDVYRSYEMEEYFDVYRIYIPFAEDPVGYMHGTYERINTEMVERTGMTYWESMGYSKAQEQDYWHFIDNAYGSLEITVGYSLGWDVLCSVMQFLPVTLGMVLIVVLGPLFSQEQADGMLPILRTTKNGRARLLCRKLGIAGMTAGGLWLLFQLVMLVAVAVTYTLQGAECTAICFFSSNTLNLYGLSWAEFYLINCAFSFLGTLVFALFVCCMSSLLKLRLSMPIGMVLTLLTGYALDHFCRAEPAFSLLEKLQVLTPAQLMASYPTLQVYQSYDVGGWMVQLPYMMAFAIAAEAAAMLLFLFHREGRR